MSNTNSAQIYHLPSSIEGTKVPKMVTVKEAAAATGLPQGFLRSACIDGTITHIRSGTKIYINLNSLLDTLNGKSSGKGGRNGK